MAKITYLELFEEWFKIKNLTRAECVNILGLYIYNTKHVKNQDIQDQLQNFVKNVEFRWRKPNNYKARFMNVNKTWLETIMALSVSEDNLEQSGPSRVGRPSKNFSESGTRSQQKKVQNIVASNSLEQLSRATQSALWKNGKRDAALMLKDATEEPTTSIKKIGQAKSQKNICLYQCHQTKH